MANEFKPTVGSKVSKEDADKWIEKFDKDFRKDKQKDTKSVFFGKDILLEILNTPGCSGISFFFSVKHNEAVGKDTMSLVMVGTREDGKLLNGSADMTVTDGGGTTSDSGLSCPPSCPTP